jgi:hypothetical protein
MPGDFFFSISDFRDVIKQIGVLVARACEHMIVHHVTPEVIQLRQRVTICLCQNVSVLEKNLEAGKRRMFPMINR